MTLLHHQVYHLRPDRQQPQVVGGQAIALCLLPLATLA